MTQRTGGQGRGVGGMSGRAAAWLAWSLVVLSVVLLVGGLSFALMTRSSVPERPYDGLVTLSVLALAFSVVGAIIASRQPRNAIGWIFGGVGLLVGLNTLAHGYADYWLASGSGIRSLAETAAWFSSWTWIPLLFVPTSLLLLLFPDGRLLSPRWRPVAWCAGFGIVGFVLSSALKAGGLGDFPQISNPYGVDSIVVSGFVSIWSVPVSIVIISVALLGLPVFTGIAIMRYRLYDIDIVINRTLVYGALTAALVAVYFGGVATVQALFRALTGQEQQPQLAIVVSTLAIAALFDPLRRRIQSFIDRRFYRRKYDAAKTLEAFSAALREETDRDALSEDLVGVVRETIQPAHASLWLHPDPALKDKKQRAVIRESGHRH